MRTSEPVRVSYVSNNAVHTRYHARTRDIVLYTGYCVHSTSGTLQKSINLALVEDVIQQIETFKIDDETQYTIASNHYSTINLTGKMNPWQSLQECIEGKATYAIPGYP